LAQAGKKETLNRTLYFFVTDNSSQLCRRNDIVGAIYRRLTYVLLPPLIDFVQTRKYPFNKSSNLHDL